VRRPDPTLRFLQEARVLDWFGGEATVPELIQRKKYDKAERLLRKEFEGGRRDATLRLQLADVIALAGRSKEAVPIYIGLVDEFARSGHAPKAIAILKKIDKISPGRGEVAKRLATLIGDHGKGAAAAPAPPREAVAAYEPAPVFEPAAFEPPPVAEPEPEIDPVSELGLDLPSASTPPGGAGAPTELGRAFSSPLFGEFSREDLLAVIGGLRFLTFEPGDIIVGDEEPGDSLFVISSGRVKAFVKGAEGRYRETREMGEGDFFGEIALLYGRPRTATVTAAESCELLELERDMVQSLAATRPRVREVLESFCNARVGAGP
jgi:cAMP-dependent protein kinase regulator